MLSLSTLFHLLLTVTFDTSLPTKTVKGYFTSYLHPTLHFHSRPHIFFTSHIHLFTSHNRPSTKTFLHSAGAHEDRMDPIQNERANRKFLVLNLQEYGDENDGALVKRICASINDEIELIDEEKDRQGESVDWGLKIEDFQHVIQTDKTRLHQQGVEGDLDHCYALVELRLWEDEVADYQKQCLELMLEKEDEDEDGQDKDGQDEDDLDDILDTILWETTAREEVQFLQTKTWKGEGEGPAEDEKTKIELLRECFKDGEAELARQEGWTAEKAKEAYGLVKQAFLG